MAEQKIQFINTSKETKKILVGLAKTALREDGKIIRKVLRDNIPVRSKRLKNHIASWARIDNKTGQPILEVGFYSRQRIKKRGKTPSRANPHWIEFGVRPHVIRPNNAKAMGYDDYFFGKLVNHPGYAGTHVLRNAVYDNIDEIRAKQAEFLGYLNETLEAAGAKIIDSEEVEDD